MKKTLVLVLSVALGVGAFAAGRLGAQTTGAAGTGVPPALTIAAQDPNTTTAPAGAATCNLASSWRGTGLATRVRRRNRGVDSLIA